MSLLIRSLNFGNPGVYTASFWDGQQNLKIEVVCTVRDDDGIVGVNFLPDIFSFRAVDSASDIHAVVRAIISFHQASGGFG
jgi:microsomal dipeptidase-like Zn-dependent dipeptidase